MAKESINELWKAAVKKLNLTGLGLEPTRDIELYDDMIKIFWTHRRPWGETMTYMIGQIGICEGDTEMRAYEYVAQVSTVHYLTKAYDPENTWAYKVAASADWKYATDEEIAKVRMQLLKEIRLIEDLENAADDFMNYCKIKMEETAN